MPLLTDEIERRMTATKESKGRLPRFDTVAKALKIPEADAKTMLNEYRTKHEGRVRTEPQGPPQPQPPKPKRPWWDTAVDTGALAVGVGISMILNVVVFFLISPDLVTAIGMMVLAPVVVLFSVRGWILGGVIGKTLWVMFVLVEVFSGISFSLASTDLQAKTGDVDSELIRLTDKVTHDQTALDTLQAGYNAIGSGFRGELSVRQTAIEDARKALQGSELARKDYLDQHKEGATKRAVLTSDKVFSAIPDAIRSGRWIQTVFFSLIFCGLALTIVSAATSTVRKKE